ncbi:hypothetical protein KKB10_00315 [Patescibacteria group bacterium]|nr:hypothetical protein [Patescibacteria group bacterium]MBU1075574.1 hypothetical protein [Patescibacteria group bacterium]MBU1951741.1 hypothetical protein [Patescibacteria group bacterium]
MSKNVIIGVTPENICDLVTIPTPAADECVVLYMRHLPHKRPLKNVTPTSFLAFYETLGGALQGHVKISAACATPQPRSYSHLYAFCVGNGNMPEIRTEERQDAVVGEGPEVVAKLKADATADDSSIEVVFLGNDDFAEMRARRGAEGAESLRELAATNCGKIVAQGGHGVSRMEISIAALAGRDELLHMVDRGGWAILVIKNDGTLVSESYVEFDLSRCE